MNVKRYKPQARVTLYTEKGELVARATNDPNSDIDNDIVSISTVRDMGADSPTFSISLTRRHPWHKWVASNDLLKIEMHRPPESNKTVFYGLVDDVRKRVTLTGDSVERVVTISGRGLSKSLIQFDIGVVPESGYSSQDTGWLVDNGITLASSSADEIIRSTWELLGRNYVNYKWSNGKDLYSTMKLKTTGRRYMTLIDDLNLIEFSGSIWALMKEVAEEPFYELYWEVLDETPTLVLRPTPFNAIDWNALPLHVLTDDVVILDDIGRSDIETFTLYSVGAKALYAPEDAFRTLGVLPYWYKPFASKYGIRRLHVESAYTSMAEDQDMRMINEMTSMQVDLFNWNIKNNQMFNGTLAIMGTNKIKVGDRVRYDCTEDDTHITYYVKSVVHSFVNFGTWTTELGVIRGLNEKDRFSSPFGAFTEFTGLGIEMVSIGANAVASGRVSGASNSPLLQNRSGGNTVTISGGNPPPPNATTAQKIIHYALDLMNQNRVTYAFGGPGIDAGRADCSQFTQYIFRKYANMEIGRNTTAQMGKGVAVSKSNLQPGDLLMFKNTWNNPAPNPRGVSHVGIYIGNNQFVHLSTPKIRVDSLTGNWGGKYWLEGRRLL